MSTSENKSAQQAPKVVIQEQERPQEEAPKVPLCQEGALPSQDERRIVRLHLGCADKRLAGYVNIDVHEHPHVDLICDVQKLVRFQDSSVDEIYACHVLEHFGRLQVLPVLCEWNRVLKMGGTIRISVPDFESCVRLYQQDKSKLLDLMGLLYGGQRDVYDYHSICFDFESLSQTLKRCGFDQIKRYEAQQFLPKGFDDYSLAYLPHKNPNGQLMSLNIVATKTTHIPTLPTLDEYLAKIVGKKLQPRLTANFSHQ